MPSFKSILKPEGSIMAGLATVAAVYGIYQLNMGSSAQVQATDANHPVLESSRKKAAYTSLILVSTLVLITRDANVGILGWGTVAAMEFNYRHAIMAHPLSGMIQPPSPGSYEPAENVYPMDAYADAS